MTAAAGSAARGEPGAAAPLWLEAAARYDGIGAVSDAVLATAWAARAFQLAGHPVAAAPLLARVRAFAERNRAPRLLALAVGEPLEPVTPA